MKKSILFLAIAATVSFASLSCSSDDTANDTTQDQSINLTDAEAIQRHILNGYWQNETTKDSDSNEFVEVEYYWVYKFLDNGIYEPYSAKGYKYSDWHYRIKTLDGKAVFITYSTTEDYDNDVVHDYNIFDISIENNRLKLVNRKNNYADYFKYYATMAETKDLPSGGL